MCDGDPQKVLQLILQSSERSKKEDAADDSDEEEDEAEDENSSDDDAVEEPPGVAPVLSQPPAGPSIMAWYGEQSHNSCGYCKKGPSCSWGKDCSFAGSGRANAWVLQAPTCSR
jgi:hypothetical protein